MSDESNIKVTAKTIAAITIRMFISIDVVDT